MHDRILWRASALMAALATVGIAGAAPSVKEASPVGEGGKTLPKPSTERTLRLPDTPFHYADIDLPGHFKTLTARRFDNAASDNPLTDDGATLGRVLFYDTRLSVNNTIACGSCHEQKHAFSDPKRASKGFGGQLGDRNAMSLVNLRYYPRGRFFWDERARSLEEQVLMPI